MNSEVLMDTELVWRRPKLIRREYELLNSKGTHVARLVQTGILRPKATILETTSDRWTQILSFERTGIIRQQIHVKPVDPTLPAVSRIFLSWKGKAQIELVDGRRYRWDPDSFWMMSWTLRAEGDIKLAAMRRKRIGYGGSFSGGYPGLKPDESRLLLYLGWYLAIVKTDDAAAAAAAAG